MYKGLEPVLKQPQETF